MRLPTPQQPLPQSLPHTLPQPLRSQHRHIRHPRENPSRQFLPAGGLQDQLQPPVAAPPHPLARVPHPLADIRGHLPCEDQPHLPGLFRLADAKGAPEESTGVERGRAGEVFPGATARSSRWKNSFAPRSSTSWSPKSSSRQNASRSSTPGSIAGSTSMPANGCRLRPRPTSSV